MSEGKCSTMMPRVRRADCRFYITVTVLVLIVLVVWQLFKPLKVYDFSQVALNKLQLTSGSKPSSCGNAGFDTASSVRVSVVVSTQASEDAVITQTVNSILAHTDPALLEQIIIATDKRITEERRQLIIKEFAEYEPLVTIVNGNSEERLSNKLVTGHIARGDVVVFIDDTVVVTDGYLPPLLSVLRDHPERIAVPSFDYLADMTASAEMSGAQRTWMFDWHLNIQSYELGFQELASKPENEAFIAMVFDSSAFALHKNYLKKLGSLKNNMDYKGSLDLSFATWLCGDGAYVVPCSRVAKMKADLTIQVEDEKVRFALAKRYFTETYFRIFRRVNKIELGFSEDENAHMKIEASLQKKCPKDFGWYMKNVAKDVVFVPSDEAVAFGYFNSASGQFCFRQTPAMIFLGYYGCKTHTKATMVEFLKTGQLRHGSECITGSDKNYLVTEPCDYDKDSFKWETSKYRQFKDYKNRCISHSTDPYPEEKQRQVLMFTDCTDESNPDSLRWQKWNSFTWLQ